MTPPPPQTGALVPASAVMPVSFDAGFYEEERDGADRFRWMQPSGVVRFAADLEPRFLECWVFSEFRDLSQQLTVSIAGTERSVPLVTGWTPFSMVVPPGADQAIFSVNKAFPREYYPADHRTLAVRLREVRVHQDAARHAAVMGQSDNLRLNQEEVTAGRTVLTSTPPSLGIDLHGVCNVKPPCVYCEWDFSKGLEGDRATIPFTRETLEEWGEFFDNSVTLINCSIGEPFMMRNLDELLDIFRATGKYLQMTTNGQILTDRNIQRLLGLPIDLYVSLDAATPETYAKLRNNTFDRLVGNLRRLIQAKGGRGALPNVHLVFMPMRCNVHELEAFVRLAADLGADRLVLRPLNYTDTALDWERAGHHFNYKNELLPFDELVRASARAARLCRELHVELSDQMDFGGAMREMFPAEFEEGEAAAPAAVEPATALPLRAVPAPASPVETFPLELAAEAVPVPIALPPHDPKAPVPASPRALPSLGGEHAPACLEPWKSLYILRRGVLPCCYGGEPLAPMEDYRSVWNSPTMQAIRGELLRGRFHDYCLRSTTCPIVRKLAETRGLPVRHRLLLRGRHAWGPINRAIGELPNRLVYLPLKRAALRVQRAATQRGYIRRHSRRILAKWTGRSDSSLVSKGGQRIDS